MPPRHTRSRRSTQPAERDAFLDALEFAPDSLSGVERSQLFVCSSLSGDCVSHLSIGEMIFSEFYSQGQSVSARPL